MARIERRELIRLGVAALIAGGSAVVLDQVTAVMGQNVGGPRPSNGGPDGTPTPTVTPTIAPATATVTATVTPRATEKPAVPIIERDGVRISGVPDRIDSRNVDVAKGAFKNTLGLDTEAFIAEPGGLLVGPDFGSKSAKNPSGENPAGWDAMYDAGGSIKPFSPVSQEILRYAGPAFQNLPEGGFVFASAGQMTARVGGATFEFRPEQGKN